MSRLLFAVLSLLLLPACAESADAICSQPLDPKRTSLDWSDGSFRICSPRSDVTGRRYADGFQLDCTIYVDAVEVVSMRARPGQLLQGPHYRTGTGIATAVCRTPSGLASEPATPLLVKLSDG